MRCVFSVLNAVVAMSVLRGFRCCGRNRRDANNEQQKDHGSWGLRRHVGWLSQHVTRTTSSLHHALDRSNRPEKSQHHSNISRWFFILDAADPSHTLILGLVQPSNTGTTTQGTNDILCEAEMKSFTTSNISLDNVK